GRGKLAQFSLLQRFAVWWVAPPWPILSVAAVLLALCRLVEKETSLDEVLTTLELPPGRLRRRAKAPRAMVLDALQRQPPLHILNARDSVAAEFPKFEHLPRPLTGPAAQAS
ncbi:MAG: hypothetical protein ABSH35_08975, partial [Isosphaeraceae bacterium]